MGKSAVAWLDRVWSGSWLVRLGVVGVSAAYTVWGFLSGQHGPPLIAAVGFAIVACAVVAKEFHLTHSLQTFSVGSTDGSTNSPMLGTFSAWAATCAKAIKAWVLPPPYCVSIRKIALASPPLLEMRRHTLSSRRLRPSVGCVLAKNVAASWY